mgnify:FL=1
MLPVEGGDTPYLQQQNFALAALAKRDGSDNPFGTAPQQGATTEPNQPPEDDNSKALSDHEQFMVKAMLKGLLTHE